jgi:heterodisulfide reductase subunit C2
MQHNENKIHSLADQIEKITSQSPMLCYQCGKCSAGCPVRDYMDDAPNRIVRLVQLGFDSEALSSSTIWLCAGCLMCSSRCPQNFDLAKFMDAMRESALSSGVEIEEKNILAFHKSFLKQIKNNGRAFELGFVGDYKLHTMDLLQDVDVAPEMFLKGKIGLFPHRVKDSEGIKKIFDSNDRIDNKD